MTDFNKVADIFKDFLGAYNGQKPAGIAQLYKRYEGDRLFAALMGNLNAATKVNVPKALIDMYEVFKEYRGMPLSEGDWEFIVEEYSQLDNKYEKNRWCEQVMLELLKLLEDDSDELSGKKKERKPERTDTELKTAA